MTSSYPRSEAAHLPRPIGLALSGGGFRAMLFHVGGIIRLNELGLLRPLDEVAGVSGGAIVAGRLGAVWSRLRFVTGSATNLWEEFVTPLLAVAEQRIDVRAVTRALVPGISAARQVERAYRRHVVGGLTLGDLPARPRFSFLAVHLPSGEPWVFDRRGAESRPIGRLRDPGIPLARAISASSAYPPFLAPLVLHLDPEKLDRVPAGEPRAVLGDGGLHDNLGLHALWERSATVLSSDAGGVLATRERTSGFWWRQLIRTIEIHADRSRSLRRHAALDALRSGQRAGTLWRIDATLADYPVQPGFHVDRSWPPYLAAIRTRLDRFELAERCRLVNWGYLVADVAVRSHVLDGRPPSRLPFPSLDFVFPAPGAGTLAVSAHSVLGDMTAAADVLSTRR